jgi:hypothetical protein
MFSWKCELGSGNVHRGPWAETFQHRAGNGHWGKWEVTVSNPTKACPLCFAQPAPGSNAQIKFVSARCVRMAAEMRIQQAKLHAAVLKKEINRTCANHNQDNDGTALTKHFRGVATNASKNSAHVAVYHADSTLRTIIHHGRTVCYGAPRHSDQAT